MNRPGTIRGTLAAIAIAVAFGTVGSMDAADAAAEERVYCEMVEIWNRDAAAGLPPMERGGWPNYRRLECR